MKIKDLNLLDNPDNLSIIYFSEDGQTTSEDSLAELVDKVTEKLREILIPSSEQIANRLLELGIVLEVAVTPELTANEIKLDYIFEDTNHAIWFNVDSSLGTDLGFLSFTINGVETPVYLRGKILETSYFNRGYYLIVYSKEFKAYSLNPVLPKDLGFINTKKYKEGIFSDLLDITDYNFLYLTNEYTGDIEKSLFYDLPESLLFNALSYTLKIVKTKVSEVPLDGYVQIYNVLRSTPEGSVIKIPSENIFIPKNQAFYLYKN